MRGPRTVMKSDPHLPQLEKALAQKRRPNTAINKINLKKKMAVLLWVRSARIPSSKVVLELYESMEGSYLRFPTLSHCFVRVRSCYISGTLP